METVIFTIVLVGAPLILGIVLVSVLFNVLAPGQPLDDVARKRGWTLTRSSWLEWQLEGQVDGVSFSLQRSYIRPTLGLPESGSHVVAGEPWLVLGLDAPRLDGLCMLVGKTPLVGALPLSLVSVLVHLHPNTTQPDWVTRIEGLLQLESTPERAGPKHHVVFAASHETWSPFADPAVSTLLDAESFINRVDIVHEGDHVWLIAPGLDDTVRHVDELVTLGAAMAQAIAEDAVRA